MKLSLEAVTAHTKIVRRIVIPLLLAYIVAYVDRINVGFAKLQMLHDLAFSETTFGLGAGTFFIGYFLFGVPSNLILRHVGARRCIGTMMIFWGLLSSATIFVRTPSGFYVLRFLLGVAEAGFFPGVIFYLTQWFPANKRAVVTAMFMTAVAISGAIGSPLSGWIMQSFDSDAGLAGWQWVFLLEGLPAIVMGAYLLSELVDSPLAASWLSQAEREATVAAAYCESNKSNGSIVDALQDRQIWLLCVIYFCAVIGLYGISFWLPTIISEMAVRRPLEIGLLTALPYAVAVIVMMLTAHSADRHGEHRWHVAVPATCGALALIVSATFPHQQHIAIAALTVATCGILTTPPLIWIIPTKYLMGVAAAAGIGLINSFGNLAGFASPYVVGWIKDHTGSTALGMYVVGVFVLFGACLAIFAMPALPKGRACMD